MLGTNNEAKIILETLSINLLLNDLPVDFAILNTELQFISHSKFWRSNLNINDKNIVGQSIYKVLPNLSAIPSGILNDCLNGKKDVTKVQKYVSESGKTQWLKWKVNPWKNDENQIAGVIVVKEDITKEKREEELLLKAEGVGKIGGWEVDFVTNKLYWTNITKIIHEQPIDYEPNLEEAINYYQAGRHREKITQLLTEAMTEGKAWDTELIIVTAKNKELWVRAKGEPEMINGKCVRIIGTFQEIDEKKKAEIKYQETAERLKLATTISSIGIWEYDIITNEVVWDDSMYVVYGTRKEDFKGVYEAWQSGLHPDDLEQTEQDLALAISGEKEFNTEFRIIWPNGQIRHIKGIGIAQRDTTGKAIKMIGTNWDITELKKTQLSLHKTRESLQGSFNNSSIGMALVELDGKWSKINKSLSNSIGYQEQELIKLTFQDITHPEDLDKDLALLEEVINGNRESYQLEKRFFHKKGHVVHMLLTVTAVKDIAGNLSHFISQLVDLSSEKESQNKLSKLLDISTEQNSSLMNFAHIVSHNLRSHSTNMSMLTQFLEAENSEKERNKLVAMLKEASLSLSETVMHLNEVVNVKTNAFEIMKEVNLYDVIMNVKKNISLILKENKVTCNINIPKNETINAIPAYIDSIILNLFTNSIKYRAANRPLLIDIQSQNIDNKLLISFTDNGLGIDLERHRNKIFGMYKTFHKHKEAKGVGLFLTKNHIEAMNGRIDVTSKVGVGTTFKLYFETSSKVL